MQGIIKMLHEGDYSCVVENNDGRFTFSQRGIADLYDMVKNKPGFLNGASVADKVVGKGAAALMIAGGVRNIYADLISNPALTLLREAGIEPGYGHVVPFIQNRTQTDWCPVEKMCREETSPEKILVLIEEFIGSMRKKEHTGQHTANFGQIVPLFQESEKGYDLERKLCPFLAFSCLSDPTEIKQKTLQVIELVGFVLLLAALGLAFQRRERLIELYPNHLIINAY